MILEPQPEIRELVRRVAARLGYEALTDVPVDGVDAVVLEPESLAGLGVARQLRDRLPELPIICTSIAPPSAKTRELAPVAYLVKPFTLQDLQRVLSDALPASSVDAA